MSVPRAKPMGRRRPTRSSAAARAGSGRARAGNVGSAGGRRSRRLLPAGVCRAAPRPGFDWDRWRHVCVESKCHDCDQRDGQPALAPGQAAEPGGLPPGARQRRHDRVAGLRADVLQRAFRRLPDACGRPRRSGRRCTTWWTPRPSASPPWSWCCRRGPCSTRCGTSIAATWPGSGSGWPSRGPWAPSSRACRSWTT